MNVVELPINERPDGRYYREFHIGEHDCKGGARVRTVLIVEGPARVAIQGNRIINDYFLRREKLAPGATAWEVLMPRTQFVKLSQEDMFAIMAVICQVNSGRNAERRENAATRSAKWRRSLQTETSASPVDAPTSKGVPPDDAHEEEDALHASRPSNGHARTQR